MKIIKKYLINKIVVYTLCLFLLLLFYLVPTHEKIKTQININNELKEQVVYLLDKDNYVSRVITYFDKNTIEEEIKEKINILINGSNEFNTFYPLIPKGTRINSLKIEKNNIFIDFSEELLKVNKYMEESMIEAIVYTLNDINGIDNIYISINGNKLDKYPNSKKEIMYPLNRSFGINKEYSLNSFNNICKTTVFFYKENDELKYLVPVSKIINSNDEKINIIINELKSSINSQNNLNGYYTNSIKLIDYKIEDDKIILIFNDNMFNDRKVYNDLETLISYSIFSNYDINEIIFKNSNSKIYKIVKRDS